MIVIFGILCEGELIVGVEVMRTDVNGLRFGMPGLLTVDEDDRPRREEIVRYHRDKKYGDLHRDPDVQGKLLYIQHELMISRMHFLIESGCKKLGKGVVLEQWKQGAELWNRVECPKVTKAAGSNQWSELESKEHLPHRPDAFFTLRFPDGRESHFLYEADRGTENTTRIKLKLRAHHHFIVKQQLQRTTAPYKIHSIRAVLIESTNKDWASQLRESAKHPVVSPKPSPLFWFTTSELFFSPATEAAPAKPIFLDQPELIFKRIWASPAEDKLFNLAD